MIQNDDDDADLIMLMEVLLDHESFHRSLAAGAQIYQLPLPFPAQFSYHSLLYAMHSMHPTHTKRHAQTHT